MTLNDIIRLVDEVYPDGQISRCWDFFDSRVTTDISNIRDTLALTTVCELKEAYYDNLTDEEKLSNAVSAMNVVIHELERVRNALANKLEEL